MKSSEYSYLRQSVGKMAKEECIEVREESLGWSLKKINILEIRRGSRTYKKNSGQRGRRKIKRSWYQQERASGRKTWSTMPNAKRRNEW